MKLKNQKSLTITLFVVYMLLLIGIVLFKLPFYSPYISDGIRVINLIPFRGAFNGNEGVLREIIDNTLIFIPLGIYVCMLKGKWIFLKKIIPIIALTLAFETIQFIFAMGRSDITDILDNTLGGVIGIGIYAVLFKIFGERTAKIINIIALVVTVIVVLRFSQLFYFSNFGMRRMRP